DRRPGVRRRVRVGHGHARAAERRPDRAEALGRADAVAADQGAVDPDRPVHPVPLRRAVEEGAGDPRRARTAPDRAGSGRGPESGGGGRGGDRRRTVGGRYWCRGRVGARRGRRCGDRRDRRAGAEARGRRAGPERAAVADV
ncbi:MAG: hypothetical protein AVDCRST_MAG64-2797, partial [uncultured Phycisphaerae bacterium]